MEKLALVGRNGSVPLPDPAFWAGRRVLVTGHTGFKGSWLLVLLDALGARVTGLALPPETVPSMFDMIGGGSLCDHHVADIGDAAAVEAIFAQAKPEIVLHLAAQPLVRASYADPLATYRTNVLGTAHVLEACRNTHSVSTIVSVTTDKCYANDGRAEGYREDAPLGGHDPYSSSKACAELVSACWRDSFLGERGIGLATARAGNVIGGGDWSTDRLVPDAIRALSEKRALEIRNPDAVRPWQHVLEPLTGYLLLAQALANDPSRFARGWNFGPAPADMASVCQVIDMLGRHMGATRPWTRQPGDHPHEAAMLTLDSSAAAEALGWRPRLSLDRALALTADWYRATDKRAATRAQAGDFLAMVPA
ncbi:CDP-glucose 4,6-dehydratase [Sphingobium chlorophenolicum]|uniref:CDP-glucose 4,6-dehydratase n=1 Tax=Sphingobium chlorophenolicum TaxID=46429 RepID=A0A081RGN4_SPHCR|nr:CDP-glucose 4,6-dehydratase [Sphingobium chlorophenolicum]KEQ54357.1 CDP-glucose 4,6-dehydratase [Sphingobium chlorophenolicum]